MMKQPYKRSLFLLDLVLVRMLLFLGVTVFFGLSASFSWGDPWQEYPGTNRAAVYQVDSEEDPWTRLQAAYLPFMQQEAQGARILIPFKNYITDASVRFQVPPEIIGAVILVESGGDPEARAETSTAKGLMQTIDATFAGARRGLRSQGFMVADNPFEPRASIMAGTWYLSRMYERARRDRPTDVKGRDKLTSWRYPAQYYYVGPGHGRKAGEKAIIYSGGRKLVVDKEAYSAKVMKWAKVLSRETKNGNEIR